MSHTTPYGYKCQCASCEDRDVRIDHLQEQLRRAGASDDAMRKQLAARDATIAELRRDSDRMKSLIEMQGATIAELRAELAAANMTVEAFGDTFRRTDAELRELRAEVERLRTPSVRSFGPPVAEALWKLQKENERQHDRAVKAEAEVWRLRKEKALANPEATLAAVRGMTEADELRADLHRVQSEYDRSQNARGVEVAELRSDLKYWHSHYQTQLDQATELRAELATSEADADGAEQAIKILGEEAFELRAEVERLKHRLLSRADWDALQAELAEALAVVRDYRALLADPHPGLASWAMYVERVDARAAAFLGKDGR